MLIHEAESLLRKALNNQNAKFRDGQWEAIEALTIKREKLLVVQRTGWGKSSVYFMSTKIFRDQGLGPTIIISPLLALMRNQVEAAEKLGVKAATINSSNISEWDAVIHQILNNQIDCLLISPERLANDNFIQRVLNPIANKISMLVIDEAHCISDWGHDFRPDYKRIVNILRNLPSNLPLLATTATANDRVITDIHKQLGDIKIIRGTLTRDNLALQTIKLADQPSRLAWLAQNLQSIKGTGIIYVLTKNDAELVSRWLNFNGINSLPYYSGILHNDFRTAEGKLDSDLYREHLEKLLLNNNIKVLVATTALGMGYDKPDLGFVIHYQAPNSVISYYQQVGRAGRGINKAIGILLNGYEDEVIHNFFRDNAFPKEYEINNILYALNNADGLSIEKLEKFANLRKGRIEHALKYLNTENPSPVSARGAIWYRNPVNYQLNQAHIEKINAIREQEWHQMLQFINTDKCYMHLVREYLDDKNNDQCGICANCTNTPLIDIEVNSSYANKAASFIKHSEQPIEPRKQIASSNEEHAKTFKEYQFPRQLGTLCAQEGRVLSRWGDSGWARLVKDGKDKNYFSDELVNAVADMITQRWKPNPTPQWICCVPSLNHKTLVPDFAARLANKLGIPFIDVISKIKENEPQKHQNNRFHQCKNLDGVFEISSKIPNSPVLLIDDMVDSRWTFTVIAALLRQHGSGEVFPVALASTSVNES